MVVEFTEKELSDIQKYIYVMNSPAINNQMKEKLKQVPPPKYDLYLELKKTQV